MADLKNEAAEALLKAIRDGARTAKYPELLQLSQAYSLVVTGGASASLSQERATVLAEEGAGLLGDSLG
jgi:hypothetical protein